MKAMRAEAENREKNARKCEIGGIRFWTIFGMHFCIQFSYRFWTGFGMNFLSEVQMFHNAETLKKLFSPQFLQCFVNVALFRMRTETIDNLLWNAKKKPLESDGKSIKNQSKIVVFESSESNRDFGPIMEPFWTRFGTILGPF